jgi:hypothetical protein
MFRIFNRLEIVGNRSDLLIMVVGIENADSEFT